MLEIILATSIAFAVSFLAVPVLIRIAHKKKLYDLPDERKIHKRAISSLGGVGIFIGFFLASILMVDESINPGFQYYFAAALIIFFLGLKDDLLPLTATKKFVGQLVAAAILIHLADVRITSMHGLFGYQELPEAFSLALTYLTIILIINAFNLIDGVDGLSSGLGILTMTVFGTYFYSVGMGAYSILAFSLVGSLIAFLIFNHHPAKIFMGDSGSMTIGVIAASLVIKFINVATTPGVIIPVSSAVIVGISILFLPLMDTVRVFSIRMIGGRSPFSPDRNHIHHILLDCGLTAPLVTIVCVGTNAAFIFLAYSFRNLGPNYLLLLLGASAITALGILFYVKKKRQQFIFISKRMDGATEMQTSSTVLKLTKEKAAASNN